MTCRPLGRRRAATGGRGAKLKIGLKMKQITVAMSPFYQSLGTKEEKRE
jgi:hypothetical protein